MTENELKTRLKEVSQMLCETIGPRPTGSKANQEAAAFCLKEFSSLGYQVEEQSFDCMDWQNHGASLSVDGTKIEVAAANYSNDCDVKAELVFAGSVGELKNLEAEGRILVIHSDLCKEPLMPKSMTFYNPEEHQEIIRLLEEKKPLAIITCSFLEDVPAPIIEDGDFDIPCAVVSGNQKDLLLKAKSAELKLDTRRHPSTGKNVIATNAAKQPVVSFSAHLDTAANTPGALDNASGVSTLLVLAWLIKETKADLPVEFVLFNGEDYYSTPGENLFMGMSLMAQDKSRKVAFNIDGVGLKDSPTSFSFYECSDKLCESIRHSFESLQEIEPWPMGDHMLFAYSGVPAIAITASGIFDLVYSVMHTPADTLDLIDYDILTRLVLTLFEVTKKIG